MIEELPIESDAFDYAAEVERDFGNRLYSKASAIAKDRGAVVIDVQDVCAGAILMLRPRDPTPEQIEYGKRLEASAAAILEERKRPKGIWRTLLAYLAHQEP